MLERSTALAPPTLALQFMNANSESMEFQNISRQVSSDSITSTAKVRNQKIFMSTQFSQTFTFLLITEF